MGMFIVRIIASPNKCL